MKLKEITHLQAEQELSYINTRYKNPKIIFIGVVGNRFFYLEDNLLEECDVSYALENFELA